MPIIGENYSLLEDFSLCTHDNGKESSILVSAFPINGLNKSPDLSPDKFIGSGAFGTVWAVKDPRTGNKIALKKLSNVFLNYISALRTYREIKILNTLRHENILTAHEFLLPSRLEYFQEIYILMELMQTDLHRIMSSPQILTVNHIKLFLYQILRGLKYLHSARIMHRDIKPGNLLVNSNCLLKICDFGLARTIPDPPPESAGGLKVPPVHMTTEVVTQYYRAPELLMGATSYTASIDIWSVGCIFAELFTRKILFEAFSPLDQLELITDLLGTPSFQATKYGCPEARAHFLYNCKPKLPCLDPLLFPSPTPGGTYASSSSSVQPKSSTKESSTNSFEHDALQNRIPSNIQHRKTHVPPPTKAPRGEDDSKFQKPKHHSPDQSIINNNNNKLDESPCISLPMTQEALHLLLRMLVFDPDFRITAHQALNHSFLDEGRKRFRDTFLRSPKPNLGTISAPNSAAKKVCSHLAKRQQHALNTICDNYQSYNEFNLEPNAPPDQIFDSTYEKTLRSTKQIKIALHSYLMEVYEWKNAPLLINQFSPLYADFNKPAAYQSSSSPNNT